jgi:ketosteroid isomerase-like protein
MTESATGIVLAWHAALNLDDVARLLSLCSPDVEVGGPRGVGRGAALLEDWLTRARIRLEPRRVFARGATVVVEQSARWGAEDGALSAPQDAASIFHVEHGAVTSVLRYPDLASAMQAVGLDESDAQPALG